MLANDKKITTLQHIQMLASIADSMTKTTAAFKKFAPSISELSIAMDVLKQLSIFVKEQHPDQVNFLLDILEPFGGELTLYYGK